MAKDKKEKKSSKKDAMQVDSSPVKAVEVTVTAETPKKAEKPEKEEISYETRLESVTSIAKPLANKKLTKKVYKVVKKAAKAKQVKRGVKEVVKGLRKGAKGVVFIAGDIFPVDVITHIPLLCEESKVPYVYVPSREDLGHAGATKRPTSVIMVLNTKDQEYKEAYDEVMEEVKPLNEKIVTA